jgi:gluconokinase
MVVLLMGVTGSGKTTIGQALAESLHWQFIDADDFHPSSNVAKMRAGIPLNDADRAPWLAALRTHIVGWLNSEANVVLACSALKQAYRDEVVVSPDVRVVYLRGSGELITARLKERHGHYMDPNLLSSQFATLEEPRDALVVDVDASVDEMVKQIRKGVGVPR